MISFKLTEEQEMLRSEARKFAENEILPVAAKHDRDSSFPWDVMKKAFEMGLMNEQIPQEYGGTGLSCVDSCILAEELGAGCAGIATSLTTNGLATTPILLFGTEEQKKKYLTRICEKLTFASFCLTEPGAGSDAAAIATRATKEGNHYILNGTKRFITNGSVASFFTVFASTDPDKKHRGLSAFIVDGGEGSGVTVAKKEDKMGQRASDTAELVFDNVKVPKENLLGREGQGFRVAMSTLDRTRPAIAALSVGVARAALQQSIRYSKERVQFDQPIVANQAIQFMLADAAIGIDAARMLTWRAAWLIDQGQSHSRESAMAKAYAADVAMKVTTDAVQIHGGYGYTKEYPVEKLMRDAKLLQIYEGTAQIQRSVIGRTLVKSGV